MLLARVMLCFYRYAFLLLILVPAAAANPVDCSDPGPVVTVHTDSIANPVYNSRFISARSGSFTNAATWVGGRVPTANDKVIIRGGHSVTVQDTQATAQSIGVYAGGILEFATDRNTALKVGTLFVAPCGSLIVGTEENPIRPDVRAEIIILPGALNSTVDAIEAWQGIVGIDALIHIHGAAKSATWMRTARSPLKGQSSVTLASPVTGWRAGDELLFIDTRLRATVLPNTNVPQTEVIPLSSASGATLKLAAPLAFNHASQVSLIEGKEYFPPVANLTRNVLIKSAQTGIRERGHIALIHRCDVDIRYAQFKDLGRTMLAPTGPENPIGRYPLHMHHFIGPLKPQKNGYQYTLIGNSISSYSPLASDPPGTTLARWGMVLHGSSYGLAQDNVVAGVTGAAFISDEDGTAWGNKLVNNFGAVVRGGGGSGKPFTHGNGGDVFWSRNAAHTFTGNFAAGPAHNGFLFFSQDAPAMNVGSIQGAMIEAGPKLKIRELSLKDFNDNTVWGATNGMNVWDLDGNASTQGSVKNLTIINPRTDGLFSYNWNRTVFDNVKIVSDQTLAAIDPRALTYTISRGAGWNIVRGGVNITIRNSDIEGIMFGFAGPSVAEKTALSEATPNITLSSIRLSVHTGIKVTNQAMSNKQGLFTNYFLDKVQFLPLVKLKAKATPQMVVIAPATPTTMLPTLKFTNHNGIARDNFTVYPTGLPAPCKTTRAGFEGFVCK